jgi:hypothetical protein
LTPVSERKRAKGEWRVSCDLLSSWFQKESVPLGLDKNLNKKYNLEFNWDNDQLMYKMPPTYCNKCEKRVKLTLTKHKVKGTVLRVGLNNELLEVKKDINTLFNNLGIKLYVDFSFLHKADSKFLSTLKDVFSIWQLCLLLHKEGCTPRIGLVENQLE